MPRCPRRPLGPIGISGRPSSTWIRASPTPSIAAVIWSIASRLVSRGSPLNSACAMTAIVAVVASTAMSRTPASHESAIDWPTSPKTGTSASTAGGVKLAATILRCARHNSPSELSSPRPMVGSKIRFTSRGFS